MLKKIIITFALSVALTSCVTMPKEGQKYTSSWQERKKQLATLQSWHIQGSFSMSYQGQIIIASLAWQQSNNDYKILMAGPLGFNALQLSGNSRQVILTQASGEKLVAKSPEILMQRMLGWQLPISGLYYWVRSLPIPQLPAQLGYDQHGQLLWLNQQGWMIQFLAWQDVAGLQLPSRMVLKTPQLTAKLVIHSWQLTEQTINH